MLSGLNMTESNFVMRMVQIVLVGFWLKYHILRPLLFLVSFESSHLSLEILQKSTTNTTFR
jgi:hypothetical protein